MVRLKARFHEMAGTVWVDEQDKALSRMEGHFANNFKMGGGLLVNVSKGTSFEADASLVNGEVWLPSTFAGQGSARLLLFFNMKGRAFGRNSNYRKFKASSTILPGLQEVQGGSPETAPSITPAPPPEAKPE